MKSSCRANTSGIETIKLIDGYLYMMCYYGPTLKVDPQTFAVVSRMKSMGGETGYIADGQWRWRGVTERLPERRYMYTTWRSKLVRERAGGR